MMVPAYPFSPGYKGGETSYEAAEQFSSKSDSLREQVFELVNESGFYGLTADEAAAKLQETVLNIRPRFSELSNRGRVHDSGFRRKNSNKKRQIVWVAHAYSQNISSTEAGANAVL